MDPRSRSHRAYGDRRCGACGHMRCWWEFPPVTGGDRCIECVVAWSNRIDTPARAYGGQRESMLVRELAVDGAAVAELERAVFGWGTR